MALKFLSWLMDSTENAVTLTSFVSESSAYSYACVHKYFKFLKILFHNMYLPTYSFVNLVIQQLSTACMVASYYSYI